MKKVTLENQIRSLQSRVEKAERGLKLAHAMMQIADSEIAEAAGLLKKHLPTNDYYEFQDKWKKTKHNFLVSNKIEIPTL